MVVGTVSGVTDRRIESDLVLPTGSAGGPVFSAGGTLVGVTSRDLDSGDRLESDARIIRTGQICEVLAAAGKRLAEIPAPPATHLPVEPARPFPVDALKNAIKGRAGSLNPYPMAAADFDVAFITPVLTYAAASELDQERRRDRIVGTWRCPAAAAGAAAAAARFRRLVRVRRRLPAGAARARDAEDGRKLLDHRGARCGADAGHGDPADQALQGGIRAAARLLRRRRGAADPPVQARTADLGDATRSTKGSTSSIRARWGHRAAASSWCCSRRRSQTRPTAGWWIRRSSSRSGTISPAIAPRPQQLYRAEINVACIRPGVAPSQARLQRTQLIRFRSPMAIAPDLTACEPEPARPQHRQERHRPAAMAAPERGLAHVTCGPVPCSDRESSRSSPSMRHQTFPGVCRTGPTNAPHRSHVRQRQAPLQTLPGPTRSRADPPSAWQSASASAPPICAFEIATHESQASSDRQKNAEAPDVVCPPMHVDRCFVEPQRLFLLLAHERDVRQDHQGATVFDQFPTRISKLSRGEGMIVRAIEVTQLERGECLEETAHTTRTTRRPPRRRAMRLRRRRH